MTTTPSSSSSSVGGGIAVSVAVGRDLDRVTVVGELDLASADLLAGILGGLDVSRAALVAVPGVRFADSHGLSPLFESALRRRGAGCAPLQLTDVSRAVERVLVALGVRWTPRLDLDAWRAPRSEHAPPRSAPPDRSQAGPAVLAASLTTTTTTTRRSGAEEATSA